MFYSKPESGVRVAEMVTCDWSMIIVDVLRCREVVLCSAVSLFVYLSNIFRHVYLRRQKFSFQTHTERKIGAENRRQKIEPIYGADYWNVCHGP